MDALDPTLAKLTPTDHRREPNRYAARVDWLLPGRTGTFCVFQIVVVGPNAERGAEQDAKGIGVACDGNATTIARQQPASF